MPTSAVLLISANLVPLVGVLFFEWDLLLIMLGFWAETAIIGFFSIGKILLARGRDVGQTSQLNDMPWVVRLFLVPFFCVHFGMFMAGHGLFILFITSAGMTGSLPDSTFAAAPRAALEAVELHWFLLATLLSHGFSFVVNFVRGDERDRHGPAYFMMQPYRRIIVQHIAILFGGFGLALLGSPIVLLVLLVVLKTCIDFKMHGREHRPPEAGSVTSSPG